LSACPALASTSIALSRSFEESGTDRATMALSGPPPVSYPISHAGDYILGARQ
jgi:hypothetical protein